MEKLLTNGAFLLALALNSCASGGAPSGAAGARAVVVLVPAAVAGPGEGVRAARPSAPPCSERVQISRGDSEQNALNARAGFSGHWYTYADSSGTHVVPWPGNMLGGGFSLSPGGVHSPFAAHMLGQLAKGDVVFAGIGASFLLPKAAFDAHEFSGIELWAKADPDSNPRVRFLLADQNTDPDGKVCSACFNHFGIDLSLDPDWSLQRVAFSMLEQQPGWGEPRPLRVAAGALYGFELRVVEPDAAFDVWIDDVRFVGCQQ
jgi:endoglucanase